MDVQDIIAQVSALLADAPEKIQDLISDPKGTIEELTGHSLEDADLSKIVDGVKNSIADGGIDLGGLDLGAIAEKVDLGGIADNLGGVPGGLFGKK